MLYKYLFYAYSYYIKKYDNLWDVGDTYYIGGGLFVGITINILLFNIHRIIGILWVPQFLKYNYNSLFYQLWPFVIPLTITIYLGVTGKHYKIYDEIANMPPTKKRIYKVLNIIHLLIVWGGMFLMSDYIRYYVNGYDSPIFEWLESVMSIRNSN